MAAMPSDEWQWPQEHSGRQPGHGPDPAAGPPDTDAPGDAPGDAPQPDASGTEGAGPRRRRYYPPRQCRICLDTVYPTFDMDGAPSTTSVFAAKPRVRYVSEDPGLGRLMSPCKCKGSQKYVHEGCLQAWRRSAPLSDRNFWKCPTCGYAYRMERLRMGRWLSSKLTRVALTIAVFFLTVFVLGFFADPIINLWLDPLGTIADTVADALDVTGEPAPPEPATWLEHLLKGVFSLGLLGFVKVFLAMSPLQWWNWRSTGLLGGGRRRGTGRDRLQGVSWVVVIFGVMTFLGAVWKLISALSARALEKASDRVVDVQGDDDDEEEEQAEQAGPAEESRKDR